MLIAFREQVYFPILFDSLMAIGLALGTETVVFKSRITGLTRAQGRKEFQ